ncbi:MAG: copper amine oxidase N-terminal domain-containing protein [Clostridia bacterium]|nr:copper amine oxidase N-terminal domain-containing protein [Clostridia bacterium]
MKKQIAVLLVLSLLLMTAGPVLAAPSSPTFYGSHYNSTQVVYGESTYEFEFEIPSVLYTNEEIEIPVTFKTDTLKTKGYEDVKFEITSYGPQGVLFKDEAGNTFTEHAFWAPKENFDLPANYNETTDWVLKFPAAGNYIISYKALDGANKQIAADTYTVTVKDKDKGSFTFKVPSKIYADKAADFEVTFKTSQDYEDVRFVASGSTSVSGGVVVFQAEDDDWDEELDIDGPYNKATDWKLTFNKPGAYTITFLLLNDKNQILVEGVKKVTVLAALEEDEEEDKDTSEFDWQKYFQSLKKGGKNDYKSWNEALKYQRQYYQKQQKENKKNQDTSSKTLAEMLQSMSTNELYQLMTQLQAMFQQNYRQTTYQDYWMLGNLHKLRGEKYKTYVNGKNVSFDVNPFVQNGRTLVPFRATCEALGAQVQWNAPQQQIIVSKDGAIVTIVIGSNQATVNKNGVYSYSTLDVPAQIYDSRTMVPLRFLAESLNANVNYDADSTMIIIQNI